METIFTKILKGEIPSIFLHKDELCFSILDINPVNKGHLLIITSQPYPTLESCPEEVLSHMMVLAKKADSVLRENLGCDATNLIINNGKESGQEVPHLHLHIIPRYKEDGKTLRLVKEPYSDGEIADYGKKLEF
ncbi:HIT family protein [uncultured Sphaerochaeta sp.]|uniref:HIT family protein n=1 Tax=uncultured Sphaerochaeta sp. TaxID=886478 RepID=UPI002A0A6897|nr:HIT family protein [uncultured Sphaerochaeta sp.]